MLKLSSILAFVILVSATTPFCSDASELTACYQNSSGQLRVLTSPELQCRTAETPLILNQASSIDPSKVYHKICENFGRNVGVCTCDDENDILLAGGANCDEGGFLLGSYPSDPCAGCLPNHWTAVCFDVTVPDYTDAEISIVCVRP